LEVDAARPAANAQRDVEAQRARRDRLHVHALVAGAKAHDRALSVHLLDLVERRLQRLHLVHRTPLNDLQFRPVRHVVHLYGKRLMFSISTRMYTFCSFASSARKSRRSPRLAFTTVQIIPLANDPSAE